MEGKQARLGRIEQQSLLGGVDLVAPTPRRGAGRTLRVDSRWKVGFAAALALVVEHGKKAQARAEMPARTRCPRCQKMGDTLREFGMRSIRGRRVPQSWCRTCRAAHVGRRSPSQQDLLGNSAA